MYYVGQLYISKNDTASIQTYLSGKVMLENTSGEGPEYITELQQNDICAILSINSIKHFAIQGEPGLRFSFNAILEDEDISKYTNTEENNEVIERILNTKGLILSNFGLYEIDITDFNISIDSIYVYYPEGKTSLSQDIIIDYISEGGISHV